MCSPVPLPNCNEHAEARIPSCGASKSLRQLEFVPWLLLRNLTWRRSLAREAITHVRCVWSARSWRHYVRWTGTKFLYVVSAVQIMCFRLLATPN